MIHKHDAHTLCLLQAMNGTIELFVGAEVWTHQFFPLNYTVTLNNLCIIICSLPHVGARPPTMSLQPSAWYVLVNEDMDPYRLWMLFRRARVPLAVALCARYRKLFSTARTCPGGATIELSL
jgi:hypothetical protein